MLPCMFQFVTMQTRTLKAVLDIACSSSIILGRHFTLGTSVVPAKRHRKRKASALPFRLISSSAATMTSHGNKTFGHDEDLPNYPLPDLDQTLSIYLESTKPFLSDDDFKETQEHVDAFKKNEGPKLQQLLLDRSHSNRNWVSNEKLCI